MEEDLSPEMGSPVLHHVLQALVVIIAVLCAVIAAVYINVFAAAPAFIAAMCIGAWLIRDDEVQS
jgi:Flp pilus assembly protein TadB